MTGRATVVHLDPGSDFARVAFIGAEGAEEISLNLEDPAVLDAARARSVARQSAQEAYDAAITAAEDALQSVVVPACEAYLATTAQRLKDAEAEQQERDRLKAEQNRADAEEATRRNSAITAPAPVESGS